MDLGFLFSALIYIEIPLVVSTLSGLDAGANNEDHGRDGRMDGPRDQRMEGGSGDLEDQRIGFESGGKWKEPKSWCVFGFQRSESSKYLIIITLSSLQKRGES